MERLNLRDRKKLRRSLEFHRGRSEGSDVKDVSTSIFPFFLSFRQSIVLFVSGVTSLGRHFAALNGVVILLMIKGLLTFPPERRIRASKFAFPYISISQSPNMTYIQSKYAGILQKWMPLGSFYAPQRNGP